MSILKKEKRLFCSSNYNKAIVSGANQAKSMHDKTLNETTLDEYLEALKDLYIIKDIEVWNPNFRSKTAITSTPTRHFVDTSIAAHALGMSPDDMLNDSRTFGLLFEDFAIKELSIYAKCLGGEVRHYRDANGLECDAVIHLENGEYALVEIKIGGKDLINEGTSNLQRLKSKIAESKQKMPAFSMILTAVGNAKTLEDGTYVVPINLLKD